MTQEVISQKVKKTCEGCGQSFEFELVNSSQETVEALQNWYTVIREILIMTPEGPRFHKLMVQAHALECVPAAAVKLALPPQFEPEEEVDLASLRQANNKIDIN